MLRKGLSFTRSGDGGLSVSKPLPTGEKATKAVSSCFVFCKRPIPGTRSTTHLKEMIKGAEKKLSQSDLLAIEKTIPVGWAHGDRYSDIQWIGPEKYC